VIPCKISQFFGTGFFMDQLLLLDGKKKLDELPSAKIKKSDRIGRHGWIKFYAAYAEHFTDEVLECLGVKEGQVVFDPFVGSGTTAISAQKKNASFVGWDLDPFACLLSRAKVAISADPRKVLAYLKDSGREGIAKFDSKAPEIFDDDCLGYAGRVYARIHRRVKGGRANILNNLCADSNGEFDSEVVAIVALCIAASSSAKLIKGSNPTWYRKGVPGELELVGALKKEVELVSLRMLYDLDRVEVKSRASLRVYNCDAQTGSDSLADGEVDYIVTSPPYLTRIDYVVNHLPNLILLSGLMDVNLELLRSRMIGTSKVLNKAVPIADWGDTCLNVLGEVYEHKSYASKRYYYWTYVQYFSSLYAAVSNMCRKLKVGGCGVIVVQGSQYKDVKIPLSLILVEMFNGLGLQAHVAKRDAVKVNMKNLHEAYRSVHWKDRESSEDVVYFHKPLISS
jgi:DNA modification methylase